jgi:biopolymer transport protein ExbD
MSFSVRLFCVLGFIALAGVRLSQQGAMTRPPQPQGVPAAEPANSTGSQQIVLDYSADGTITINGEVVPAAGLRTRLRSLYRSRADRTLWVSGDGSLRYGDIADVIEAAKSAGVERVGVITPEMRRTDGRSVVGRSGVR